MAGMIALTEEMNPSMFNFLNGYLNFKIRGCGRFEQLSYVEVEVSVEKVEHARIHLLSQGYHPSHSATTLVHSGVPGKGHLLS